MQSQPAGSRSLPAFFGLTVGFQPGCGFVRNIRASTSSPRFASPGLISSGFGLGDLGMAETVFVGRRDGIVVAVWGNRPTTMGVPLAERTQDHDLTFEELPDDHPDVVAFRVGQPPLPDGFLRPATDAETREEDARRKRLEAEYQKMRDQIASVTMAWAAIESEMAFLLTGLMGQATEDMGFHLYFAPGNTETRFDLVSSAIESTAITNLSKGALPAHWAPIENKLNRLRKTRNKVIHGAVGSFHMTGRSGIRLTPTFFHPATRDFKPGQLPGMSPDDVERFALSVWSTVKRVRDFANQVALARRGVEIPFPGKSDEPESDPPD